MKSVANLFINPLLKTKIQSKPELYFVGVKVVVGTTQHSIQKLSLYTNYSYFIFSNTTGLEGHVSYVSFKQKAMKICMMPGVISLHQNFLCGVVLSRATLGTLPTDL